MAPAHTPRGYRRRVVGRPDRLPPRPSREAGLLRGAPAPRTPRRGGGPAIGRPLPVPLKLPLQKGATA
ncbi:MAG: hypothetical protein ACP5OO_12500, partial [Chloroflexia bacterium]